MALPRFSRWLLRATLPADARDHVLSELDELQTRYRQSHGDLRALAYIM